MHISVFVGGLNSNNKTASVTLNIKAVSPLYNTTFEITLKANRSVDVL
jgi:hypothetical protein